MRSAKGKTKFALFNKMNKGLTGSDNVERKLAGRANLADVPQVKAGFNKGFQRGHANPGMLKRKLGPVKAPENKRHMFRGVQGHQ